MCLCYSFQQNSKVGMTVRTCICNVFECDIHCKIYTYLLHLCYIRCKLRCWIFVACSHRFLLPKSTFPWIGHPANLFQLFPCCLSSFCIKLDQYEDSTIDYISSFVTATTQEVAYWFQCWKNSTGFVWPVY